VPKICPCVPLHRDDLEFVRLGKIHQNEKGSFYRIPIKMKSRSQDSFKFIDYISMRIVPVSHNSPCHEFRYQIISLGGQLLEVDHITARVREIIPAPLNNIPILEDQSE
jgi:hypothetical protein